MKRALGAITPWDAFQKATKGEYELEDHGSTKNPQQAAETGSLASKKAVAEAELPHTDTQTHANATLAARRQSAAVLLDAHQGPEKESEHHAG